MPEPPVIVVQPAAALQARPRLFAALALAFEVRFAERAGAAVAAGRLRFDDALSGGAQPSADGSPSPGASPAHGPATLTFVTVGAAGAGTVEVARDAPVNRALRGRAIADDGAGGAAGLKPLAGEVVLARCDGRAAWTATPGGRTQRVALAPAELGPDDTLRGSLRAGRWLALAALVQWLRDIGLDRWDGPPLQAGTLFDDPNLHAPSYGFVRYREIARDAARHGYHVTFATVPIDGWFVHPAAGRTLRAHAAQLSLCVHGNEHRREEMRRLTSDRAAAGVLDQAARRADALARRSGITVDRVISAPHGSWSDAALRAAAAAGFDAAANERLSPQRVADPAPRALTEFGPATIAAGRMPVMTFQRFDAPLDDLALRAFLRQPLILYGHHDDLADGLDALRHAAGFIDGLGAVTWGALGAVAAGNFATRRDGDVLHVRPWSRRALVTLPAGVARVRIDPPPGYDATAERLLVDGRPVGTLAAAPAVELRGPAPIELRLVVEGPVQAPSAPPWRPWPYARRALAEGRDRLMPLRRALADPKEGRRAAR